VVVVELAELVKPVKLVVKLVKLVVKLAVKLEKPVDQGVKLVSPMAEAALRVDPAMMLTPITLLHEEGVNPQQQKVPAEVEHCNSSGLTPTLVILRQNCGHDGDVCLFVCFSDVSTRRAPLDLDIAKMCLCASVTWGSYLPAIPRFALGAHGGNNCPD
jgi:hypothetical protein